MDIDKDSNKSNSIKLFKSLITNPAVVPWGKVERLSKTEIEAVDKAPVKTSISAKSVIELVITLSILLIEHPIQATPEIPVCWPLIVTGNSGLLKLYSLLHSKFTGHNFWIIKL